MKNLKDRIEKQKTNEEKIKGNKKSFLRFVVLFAVILLAVMLFKFYGADANLNNNSAITGNVVANNNGNVQIAKMYVNGGQYVIEPNSFKVGIPIRIEADMSKMPGCSKSVVISAFNVRKSLNIDNNIIEFTPDKSGIFNIACSMNMYKGTFTVLQSDGVKSDYVEQASAAGNTCGAAGGGCGCGG